VAIRDRTPTRQETGQKIKRVSGSEKDHRQMERDRRERGSGGLHFYILLGVYYYFYTRRGSCREGDVMNGTTNNAGLLFFSLVGMGKAGIGRGKPPCRGEKGSPSSQRQRHFHKGCGPRGLGSREQARKEPTSLGAGFDCNRGSVYVPHGHTHIPRGGSRSWQGMEDVTLGCSNGRPVWPAAYPQYPSRMSSGSDLGLHLPQSDYFLWRRS
jgi:hypothetical protein